MIIPCYVIFIVYVQLQGHITAKGPIYLIETFLDAVLNWLVKGEMM